MHQYAVEWRGSVYVPRLSGPSECNRAAHIAQTPCRERGETANAKLRYDAAKQELVLFAARLIPAFSRVLVRQFSSFVLCLKGLRCACVGCVRDRLLAGALRAPEGSCASGSG